MGGRRNERAWGAWPSPWHWEGVRGSRRWLAGGRWRARVPASVGHTPSSFCPRRETTEGSGGGLGRQLEMGQVSGPGKSLSPFLFSFLIF